MSAPDHARLVGERDVHKTARNVLRERLVALTSAAQHVIPLDRSSDPNVALLIEELTQARRALESIP